MRYELGIVLVAGIALASGAAVVASVALLVRLLRFLDTGRDPEEPGSSGWGSGGGGATPPERPEPPGGAPDPAWWPAFERQFAEYVASFSECGVGRARRTTAAAIVGERMRSPSGRQVARRRSRSSRHHGRVPTPRAASTPPREGLVAAKLLTARRHGPSDAGSVGRR